MKPKKRYICRDIESIKFLMKKYNLKKESQFYKHYDRLSEIIKENGKVSIFINDNNYHKFCSTLCENECSHKNTCVNLNLEPENFSLRKMKLKRINNDNKMQ